MTEYFHSKCPIVRDQEMDLWQRVEVGGTAKTMPFKKRILWIRESSTKIVLRWDRSRVLENVGTRNDFYGFLTSLTLTIPDEVATLVKVLKIGPSDRLSVDLDVTIEDVPAMEVTDDRDRTENLTRAAKKYLCVPSYYNGRTWWFTAPEAGRANVLERAIFSDNQALYSTSGCTDLTEWLTTQRRAAGVDVSQCQTDRT